MDPVDIVIFWDDKNQNELTKVVNFSTNLGGIQFPSDWSNNPNGGYDVSYAQSTINIKCEDTKAADGKFTITATSNPVTTTTHVFTVKSNDAVKDAAGKDIYMRAINDLAWCNGGGTDEYQHSNMLDEQDYIKGSEENNNWRDGWYEEQNSKWNEDRSPHNGYHYVYIYTQIGETQSDGTKDENTAEWYFGGETDYKDFNRNTVSQGTDNDKYKGKWWPGRSMKADNNNPGWYYYSIAHNAMSVGNNNKGQEYRFTHHNDPGITLFNYEDNEGWYLYDPLSDPYYRVFDEKPTVVDVEYTIYTKNKKITAWYSQFGVNNGAGNSKFTMWCNDSNVPGEFECEEYGKKDGNTWYKTILHLKAPLGEYAKILVLKVNGDEIHTTLFDGDNYPSTKMHGKRYVVEGSFDTYTKKWSKGAPF